MPQNSPNSDILSVLEKMGAIRISSDQDKNATKVLVPRKYPNPSIIFFLLPPPTAMSVILLVLLLYVNSLKPYSTAQFRLSLVFCLIPILYTQTVRIVILAREFYRFIIAKSLARSTAKILSQDKELADLLMGVASNKKKNTKAQPGAIDQTALLNLFGKHMEAASSPPPPKDSNDPPPSSNPWGAIQ